MLQAEPFDADEDEALDKLERLWDAFEEASAVASRYEGSLSWKTNGSQDYLVHTVNLRYQGNRQRTRSLGPRSEATERQMEEFRLGREESRHRLDLTRKRLDVHARVLKALRLGRVPALSARFLRELHAEGLGAAHFRIGGMAALAGYEVRARRTLPIDSDPDVDFDLLPTELLVRERPLFDAIASRKIFGPMEVREDRIILGRGVVLRLLDEAASEDRCASLQRAGCGRARIEAVRWAYDRSDTIELLAVGLDGSTAPMPAVDPRAYAILAAAEAQHLAGGPYAACLQRQAIAVASVASRIVPEPFEIGPLDRFPELAAAANSGAFDADMPDVMRL